LDIFKHVKVQIRATEIIDYLYYQVISKEGILVSQQVNPNAKIFTIKFNATFAMVPEATLIVYYYRPDGEIVSDRVTLKFENRLHNFVRQAKGQSCGDYFEIAFCLRLTSTCRPNSWNLARMSQSLSMAGVIRILACWVLTRVFCCSNQAMT
jgi:Alpha-2-macroglobulin bait region domain